jgi:hypothetical protein
MMRVVEVPLGEAGVAGYAIDVEDREQARAELARFVHAQRDMLDRLSAGVAQFARDRSPDLLQPALRPPVRSEARFPRRPARVQPVARRDARDRPPARGPRLSGVEEGA